MEKRPSTTSASMTQVVSTGRLMERSERNMDQFPRAAAGGGVPSATRSRPWATTWAPAARPSTGRQPSCSGPTRIRLRRATPCSATNTSASRPTAVRMAEGRAGRVVPPSARISPFGEQPALQQAARVGHLQAHPQGAAILLDRAADLGEAGLERALEARHPERGRHAHVQPGQAGGGQVGLDLELAVVHQAEGGLARGQHLARLHQALGHLAGERGGDARFAQAAPGQGQGRGQVEAPGRGRRRLGGLGRGGEEQHG